MVDEDRPTKAVFNRSCKIQTTVFFAIFWILTFFLILYLKNLEFFQDTQIEPEKLLHWRRPDPRPSQTRIVGYYHGDYETAKIRLTDIHQLTHIVFVTKFKDILDLADPEKKIKNFQRFLKLKKKLESFRSTYLYQVQLMLSIFDDGEEYSVLTRAAENEEERIKFIKTVSTFMKTYEVGGLDFDWNLKDSQTAVDNQLRFLKTLRKDYWCPLSVSIPPYGPVLEEKMNLWDVYETVDWINVQTDDYSIPMGPPAPVYAGKGMEQNRSLAWTMKYVACKTPHWWKYHVVVSFKTRVWEDVQLINGTYITDKAPYDVPYSTISKTIKYYKLQKWDKETNTSYIYLPNERKLMQLETPDSVLAKLSYMRRHDLQGLTYRNLEDDNERGEMLSQEKRIVWSSRVPFFGFWCEKWDSVDWEEQRRNVEVVVRNVSDVSDLDIMWEDSSDRNHYFIVFLVFVYFLV